MGASIWRRVLLGSVFTSSIFALAVEYGHAQEGATFVQLGELRSDCHNAANAVSADGLVVAGSDYCGTSEYFAVRWVNESGALDIGVGKHPGYQFARAWGISSNGRFIVGEAGTARGTEAYLWSEDGGFVALGFIPDERNQSTAYAISDDGNTVVGWNWTQDFGSEPFRWTPEAGMIGLGNFPGDTNSGNASDVSADGSVTTCA